MNRSSTPYVVETSKCDFVLRGDRTATIPEGHLHDWSPDEGK